LNLFINAGSSQPIYDQIVEQLKNLILHGVLVAGDALPSMRLLAKELRVSVITTKRAYEELEREGFIITVIGKGSFVAGGNLSFLKEEIFREIETHLGRAVELAKKANVSFKELQETLAVYYKGE
jgi:GntR family transcriptional regulator